MYVVMKPAARNFLAAALVAALAGVAVPAPVQAQEAKPLGIFGDWEAYLESDGGKAVCYIGSKPKKAKGKYKKRG